MEKKLFLLDALALIFRAYYALIRNPRITSKGRNTNAQFGFTTTLIDLMNNQKPTHMAVCFDTHAPTERHTDFTDYKANRQEAPEDLMDAIPDIKRIIAGFNIPVVELDGYEADDVIGTLSIQAAADGYEVFMVTPDKDYGQLVSDRIKIYKPPYQGSSPEILGPKEICEKWNIKDVSQVIDILGLMGDAVDNIPGIAGVGEKTAAKLLSEYTTIESVLANADNIKGALGEKIRKGKDDAIISKKLATIITHVPVTFHEGNFKLKEWNKDGLKDIFTELEFKTLGKRILGDEFNAFEGNKEKKAVEGVQQDLFGDGANCTVPEEKLQPEPVDITAGLIAEFNINNTNHEYKVVETDQQIQELIVTLKNHKEISFDTETTCLDANDAELVGLSFSVNPRTAYYVPAPPDQARTTAILKMFSPLFQDESITWIGQNIKYDLLVLKWYGVEFAGPVFDTMLAHYVIEPDGKRGMDLLSAQYLKYEPIHIEELIGKKGKGQGNMRDVPVEKIKEYAAEDADITLQLKQVFLPQLSKRQVERVFNEVENPLVKVLADMEYEGIKVDVDFLKAYSVELDREAKLSEENVYKQAGVRFNLGSPRQLGEVLFEKLQLDPKAKKTKTGQYATGEDILVKLAVQNKIADDILAYRQLTKLKSTYVDALPEMINRKTGRVHTCYGQAVAVTGRLASNNPEFAKHSCADRKRKGNSKSFYSTRQ